MSATPNTHSGANSHDLGDQLDAHVDSSPQAKMNARQMENEVLLQHLLGLDISKLHGASAIAKHVAHRIGDIMKHSRDAFDEHHHEQLLEPRLKEALMRMKPEPKKVFGLNMNMLAPRRWNKPGHENENLRRAEIVIEAVREVTDANIIKQIVNIQAPLMQVNAANNGNFVLPATVSVGGTHPVQVSLASPFWKQKFEKTDDLEKALTGKRLDEVGISAGSLSAHHRLTAPEAKSIAEAKGLDVVDVNSNYGEFKHSIVNAQPLASYLNISVDKKLLKEKVDISSGSKVFADLTEPELAEVLEKEAIWQKVVKSSKAVKPGDIDATGKKVAEVIAARLFPQLKTSPNGVSVPRLSVTVNSRQMNFAYDADRLTKRKVKNPGTPPPDEVPIGSLTKTQLENVLSDPKQFAAILQLDRKDVNPTDLTPAGDFLYEEMAERIFRDIQAGTPAAQLAVKKMSFIDAQKEFHKVSSRDTSLFESENVMGGAYASALLNKYADLSSVLKGPDIKDLEDKLKKTRMNLALVQAIDKIGSFTRTFDSKTLKQVEDALKEIKDAPKAMTFGTTTIEIDGHTLIPDGSSVNAGKNSLIRQLAELKKDYAEKKKTLEELKILMRNVVDILNAAAVSSKASTLESTYAAFDTTDSSKLNLRQIADDFLDKYDLKGKTKEELEKAENELKEKMKHKDGPKGDAAQYAVIKEYFKKYKGLSEQEAIAATNEVLGKSFLDNQLVHHAERIAQEMFGPPPDPTEKLFTWLGNLQHLSVRPEARSRQIIGHIAESCHIRTKRSYNINEIPVLNQPTNFTVEWDKAEYGDLLTAFYSIKKLYDGEGPAGIRLQKTVYVQQTMKEITKALLAKHAVKMLHDFGPAAASKVGKEKAEEMKKAPTKAEHLKILAELLEGAPPESYKAKIEKAITRTDNRVDWWRRSFFGGDKYGIITGKNNKVSLRNLLYGNEYASAFGLYGRVPWRAAKATGRGIKAAAKSVNENKGGMARGAFIGLCLAGPLGAALGGAVGYATSKPAAAAGGGHDAAHN